MPEAYDIPRPRTPDPLSDPILHRMLGLLAHLAIAAAILIAAATALVYRRLCNAPRHSYAAAIARRAATEPEELDEPLTAAHWEISSAGGSLPVWDLATEGSDEHAIIMMHGWGRSRVDLLNMLDPWRTHAGRIVLYDRRGHGDAPPNQCAVGPEHARECAELLRRVDNERITVVAESLAASTILEALNDLDQHQRDRITRLVLVAPVVELGTGIRSFLRLRSLPVEPHASLALWFARLRGLGSKPLDATSVTMPVSIIHATDDPMIRNEIFQELESTLPDATRHEIEARTHLRMPTLNAEAWQQCINAICSDATRESVS